MQRERTGKLTLGDLRNYFHLPIEEAAKRLRLCPTVVKKICRRYGLLRWPHRKVSVFYSLLLPSNLINIISKMLSHAGISRSKAWRGRYKLQPRD